MLYLIYDKKETKQLINVLADNYAVITYDVKDIKEELVRKILKEEIEIDDVLIVYKEKNKLIPIRYATLDFPLAYDGVNPTKVLDSTDNFLKDENSKIDIYLNLMDYAVADDLEDFNDLMNEMIERENKENKLVFVEEDKDILDELDLDVTKENFEKVIELLNKKETFIFVQDETEFENGLQVYVDNLKDKAVEICIAKNEKIIETHTVNPNEKKDICLPTLKITDNDILVITSEGKIVYGK